VNIQQSSIEAAALISATLEAIILNCDNPLPCRLCSHRHNVSAPQASLWQQQHATPGRPHHREQQVGFSTVSSYLIVTIVFARTLKLHKIRSVLLQKLIHKENKGAQDKWRGGNTSGEQEETRKEDKAANQSSSTSISMASSR
jgi:hypothetical protein